MSIQTNSRAPTFALLSRLWLSEPDADALGRAGRDLNLRAMDSPAELASAFVDVFLLNVYPYGTAFTDEWGELNGADAQRVAAGYAAHDYAPPELDAVGAPDHLGLGLGFLAHLEARGRSDASPGRLDLQDFLAELLTWAPVCCLAVEREPSAHSFYRTLAARTRETLLAESASLDLSAQKANCQLPLASPFLAGELALRDVVHFFLTPAQCGVFFSRARLGRIAQELDARLPFESRFNIAEMLFASTGEAGRLLRLFDTLDGEVENWASEYRRWAKEYPTWSGAAETWLARTARAARGLTHLREIVQTELV